MTGHTPGPWEVEWSTQTGEMDGWRPISGAPKDGTK